MRFGLNKLSALGVRKLGKPGHYSDGGGLWLQVSGSGSKSWVFRYDLAGRRREMGLGSLDTVDLATVRTKARACRLVLLEHRDPLGARDASKSAHALDQARRITFDQCASAYIAAHRSSWKNAKHASQWENTLATYPSPLIGSLPVAAVGTDLVVKVLSPIWIDNRDGDTAARSHRKHP